jgi:hypothetical protein
MNRGAQRRWIAGLLWIVATAVVSGGVSWWLVRGGLAKHGHSVAAREPEAAFHEWMHRHLKLSKEQHQVLEPFEAAFEQDRQTLRAEIRTVGGELAKQVREAAAMTEQTREVLGRLSAAQRRLQELTLEHFYQMKAHLNEDQQAKLLRWTHDSLVHEAQHEEEEAFHHD